MPRNPKMWTKDDIRTLLTLWSKKTTDEIALVLGRNSTSVNQMANRLRKLGANIAQKRRKGSTEWMIKDMLENNEL